MLDMEVNFSQEEQQAPATDEPLEAIASRDKDAQLYIDYEGQLHRISDLQKVNYFMSNLLEKRFSYLCKTIIELLFINFPELYWNIWHQSKINLSWLFRFFLSFRNFLFLYAFTYKIYLSASCQTFLYYYSFDSFKLVFAWYFSNWLDMIKLPF